MKPKTPNQALQTTTTAVTDRAIARSAPSTRAAHLKRWAKKHLTSGSAWTA
jgi:hypothetical protein